MDLATIITSVASSLGVTAAGAWWLGRAWIEHRLDREKISWEAEARRLVETELADRAAEREYTLEARKRLYTAIGPLRFQLLLACREAAIRIRQHGLKTRYSTDTRYYYGQTTLYRILRPLAVSELIEDQISIADFTVDPASLELLRFKRAAYSALADSDPILDHPNANWNDEKEHLFSHSIGRVAHAIIRSGSAGPPQVLTFHEFSEFIDSGANKRRLSPLPEILDRFGPESLPIFWLRLVCFGYVCARLVNSGSSQLGFAPIPFEVEDLVGESGDPYALENRKSYAKAFEEIYDRGT